MLYLFSFSVLGQLTVWREEKHVLQGEPGLRVLLALLLAVPAEDDHSPIRQRKHVAGRPGAGRGSQDLQLLPLHVLEVEGVDVVEVLALPEVVVEAPEDQEVLFDQDHAVAGAGGGAARRTETIKKDTKIII